MCYVESQARLSAKTRHHLVTSKRIETEKILQLNVDRTSLSKIVSLDKCCKAVQARSVPGEMDTNSFRVGTAT